MENKYEFGGVEWTVANEGSNIMSRIKVEDFFSWGTFDRPAKYEECNFSNQAIRKCVFDSQQFIECDFSRVDASDSQFINCLFLDCKFTNANFGKTSFIGTAFVESVDRHLENSNFEGAGMSQARFLPSSKQKTVIVNIKFHSLGFRHSVFNNVIIRNTTVDYCSFENALLDECDIDLLKLDRSSCRGIVVKECNVEQFISTVEKAIGAIGILELLQSCKEINLEFADRKITSVTELIQLFVENAATMNFAKNGKLFEFVNIMQYLFKQSQAFGRSYLEKRRGEIVVSRGESIDGFRTSEFSEYLCLVTLDAYARIVERGENVDIDDILYSLKMMYFLDIHEYKFMLLLESMLDQMNISLEEDYTQSVSLSQINYYFDKVGQEIKKDTYQLVILDESVNWKNPDERLEFQKFIDELFASCSKEDYRLVSLHEGSAEAIFDIIRPEYILTIIVVLGVRLNYSEKTGIEFRFEPSAGLRNFGSYLNKVASIFPLLGQKKVEEDVFNQILKSISDSLKNYVARHELSGKVAQRTARRSLADQKRNRIKLPCKADVAVRDKKGNK